MDNPDMTPASDPLEGIAPDAAMAPPGGTLIFNGTKAPDGSYWISVTHTGPAMSFTWGIPLDRAEDIANGFVANIKELAATLRRERAGLIVVAPTHPNGNRATRRAR